VKTIGFQRALSEDNRLSFSNNESLHEFVITIARNVIADSDTKSSDLDTDSDTLSRDSDTKISDLDTDSDTSIRVKLNNKQKDVVNFCSVPRSSKEILERVGVSYHTKNIDKYINFLVNVGYLEMTNPENPNASNQKYRKKIKK
jgi:hypothetical protein